MLTAFDVGIGLLVFISAILATARGLTREVLSLGTWAGSALFAVWMWQTQPEIARGFISEELVADIATVIVSFIVSLIVLHLITVKVADFVVDSRIGPLDRTLGFVFGALRGALIGVVAVVFGQWLLGNSLPAWASESRSLPVLSSLGDSLIVALPDNLEQQITDILQRGGQETDILPQENSEEELDNGTNAGEVPLTTPA
ncbi:Colicin V production protein [hydrothermal vent metagenome]|uniref:Colicin V production protein n=1 Tax=hydrothermal vent metagenome TaxID=652676 RepID=A0A3B0UZ44_9ZZZZ